MKQPNDYLAQCLRIDTLVIEEEFVRIPSDISYWSTQFVAAHRAHSEAKLVREQTDARLTIEHKELITMKKGKATVAEVAAAVTLDPLYEQARKAEVKAECAKLQRQGVMDALRTKRDMLIQLGAHIRAEMQQAPTIRDEPRTNLG